jgi:hypothetical protein
MAAKRAASRVSRVPKPKGESRDPGGKNSKADLSEHTRAKPGQPGGPGPTKPGGNTPFPAKGPGQSSVPMRSGRGVRDLSLAATGMSLFDRVDAGNRKLGRRNRTS